MLATEMPITSPLTPTRIVDGNPSAFDSTFTGARLLTML